MKLSKEVKTGIVVTLGIAAFIFGFNFLKGKNIFSDQKTLYAVYPDVGGLVEANPVMINGYRVGQVTDINFMPDKTGRVIVTFFVKSGSLKLPNNSIARIISSDILGSKAIELSLGNSEVNASSGDTLVAEVQATLSEQVDAQVRPLKEKAEKLIGSIDSVMIVVQAVLDKGTRDNLTKSFVSIRNSIATFEKTAIRLDNMVAEEKEKLSRIFTHLEHITKTFAENKKEMDMVIKNFSSISDSIAKANITATINNTNETLARIAGILEKVERGEGSLGKLVNSDSLHDALVAATKELDAMFEDIQENPGSYVHLSVFKKEKGLKLSAGEKKKLKEILKEN